MKNIYYFMLIIAFGTIVSCSRSEENIPLYPPTAEIIVDELVREASLRNQEIPFKIINEAGDDASLEATFYVDDVAIEGNVFSSEIVGEFQVFGVYTENGVVITTNTENFKVIIPKRKVVIEDYTGTWCGFCPIITAAIEEVHAATEDIAVIAIHKTGSGAPDLLNFPQVDELREAFGVTGYPTGKINRTTNWLSPYNSEDILVMAGADTNLAIAIISELSEDNELIVEVEVVYKDGSMTGDKLVIYLLESGVIQDQINYFNNDQTSPYYQLGNPIPNFVHNHGLRNSLTNLTGDEIPGVEALKTFTSTFSLSVPENYNSENLSIVAMVVSTDNSARNAQFAEVGENKPYE
jgi:thiol-disulfide isomerase/thioredoxin